MSDASAAVVAALGSEESAIYNVAGPQVLSLRELCGEIEALVGRSARFETVPGQPSDVVGDISMMSTHLHTPWCAPELA